MKMNETQNKALEQVAELFDYSPEEVMDPDDCGEDNCSGCGTRHFVAGLIKSNPEHIIRVLESHKATLEALKARLQKLVEERDRVFADKAKLDDESSALFDRIVVELKNPSLPN